MFHELKAPPVIKDKNFDNSRTIEGFESFSYDCDENTMSTFIILISIKELSRGFSSLTTYIFLTK